MTREKLSVNRQRIIRHNKSCKNVSRTTCSQRAHIWILRIKTIITWIIIKEILKKKDSENSLF